MSKFLQVLNLNHFSFSIYFVLVIDIINDTNQLLLSLIQENELDRENEIISKFSSISGILKILLRQYTLILTVYFSDNENNDSINSIFSDLPEPYMIPLKTKGDICLIMTEIVSEYILSNLLFHIFLTCQKIYKNTLKNDNRINLNNIQILVKKLNLFSSSFL